MGILLEQASYNYGEYFDVLKNKLGVDIYVNQAMMLLYKIDPVRVAASVTPMPLTKMVQLFEAAERILVY